MHTALSIIGRIYTTSSLAVLPVACIVMVVFLFGFEEHGPQSQGLGALLVIYAMVLGVLGLNAIIAGLLSYFVVAARPTKKQFALCLVSMVGLAGLFYFMIKLT